MNESDEKRTVIRRVLAAGSFSELTADFGSPGEVLQAWCEACRQVIWEERERLTAEKPSRLDALAVRQDGVDYVLYGVVHGWAGGASAAYQELVENSLEAHEHVVFEKMLGSFYGRGRVVQAPDFWVLGRSGQLVLGLRMMLLFPWFLYASGRGLLEEIFTRADPEVDEPERFFQSVCYHNLDRELRRGLGGSFPTRLQIEYELSRWRSPARLLDEELLLAVVPRSAYIAEFARAYARFASLPELAVVVGDRHLTEVAHFLREPIADERLRAAAWAHARGIRRNRFRYHFMFGAYMLHVCLGAAVGTSPYLALLLWLSLGR